MEHGRDVHRKIFHYIVKPLWELIENSVISPSSRTYSSKELGEFLEALVYILVVSLHESFQLGETILLPTFVGSKIKRF